MLNRFPFFWFLLFLVACFSGWHLSLLFVSPFPFMESKEHVSRLLLLYPTLLLVICIPFFAWHTKHSASSVTISVAIFLFMVSLSVRALDWNVIYYYGSHIDSLFWENAFFNDGLGMIFTTVSYSLILASILLLIIYVFLLNMVVQHHAKWLNDGRSIKRYISRQLLFSFFLVYCIVIFVNISIVLPFFSSNISNAAYTNSIPEKRFISSIIDYINSERINKIVLSDKQKNRFRTIGIEVESISTEYPLLKNSIYIDEPGNINLLEPAPNIIIIFVESLSSYFIDDPEVRKHNLTPHFDNFIERSLYFDRIINAITPTLQGQIAVLASSLHLYRSTMAENKWSRYQDVKDQFNDIKAITVTEYPMISRLLGNFEYSSTHIQAGPGSFGDTENFFRLRGGYKNFLSAARVIDYPDRSLPLGIWGASDIDTFKLAVKWLESNNDNPFLLTISSIDIHHPYTTATSKRGVDNNLLNCVYSSDTAFGIFWDYFINSPYHKNTIVVLTADHPIFPTVDYLQLRKQPPSYYDYIPVAIYSPFHQKLMGIRDHTIGTNLDIAPTLFELIGRDSNNSFLGLSLLSERKNYPYYIGRINIEKKINNANTEWSDADQTLLINYLRFLSMRNRLYKY